MQLSLIMADCSESAELIGLIGTRDFQPGWQGGELDSNINVGWGKLCVC